MCALQRAYNMLREVLFFKDTSYLWCGLISGKIWTLFPLAVLSPLLLSCGPWTPCNLYLEYILHLYERHLLSHTACIVYQCPPEDATADIGRKRLVPAIGATNTCYTLLRDNHTLINTNTETRMAAHNLIRAVMTEPQHFSFVDCVTHYAMNYEQEMFFCLNVFY